MHEMKKKVENICKVSDKIIDFMVAATGSGSCDGLDLSQAAAFIDMIKDLSESEKNLWKACYYKKMVEGMEPPSEEEMKKWSEHSSRYGYDNWRFTSGRFAPKGHGHYAGYKMDEDVYGDEYSDLYGYTPSRMIGDMGHNNPTDYRAGNDRYGRAYKEWDTSRRHYTESKSVEDKDEMDRHAKEHLMDTAASIREMWKHGDPELKKEIKKQMTALVGEMPT